MDSEPADPQMIVNKAKFALGIMIGEGCIDYRKLQHILDGHD